MMPLRTEFDLVAADLNYGKATNRVPFVREGERSSVELNEGQALFRFRRPLEETQRTVGWWRRRLWC